MASSTTAPRAWTPWRVVVWFGVVSLAADMVYEGARSMYGPLLAALGASATVVGLVTGAGEAMALVLRLVFGPLADRRAAHWSLTVVGYGLTAVCVPLLAVSPLFQPGFGVALQNLGFPDAETVRHQEAELDRLIVVLTFVDAANVEGAALGAIGVPDRDVLLAAVAAEVHVVVPPLPVVVTRDELLTVERDSSVARCFQCPRLMLSVPDAMTP